MDLALSPTSKFQISFFPSRWKVTFCTPKSSFWNTQNLLGEIPVSPFIFGQPNFFRNCPDLSQGSFNRSFPWRKDVQVSGEIAAFSLQDGTRQESKGFLGHRGAKKWHEMARNWYPPWNQTASLPLKIGYPKRKGSSSNHPFLLVPYLITFPETSSYPWKMVVGRLVSGAMLVSGSVILKSLNSYCNFGILPIAPVAFSYL